MSANFLDQEFPDEEDEDDFNPQPEVGSDDEADAKPNVEADDDEDEPSSERPRARSAPKDEDDLKEEDGDGVNAADGEEEGEADGEEDPQGGDEEEDEEEDEDEEDEDEEQPSRKRRKRRRNQFIDVEAEVDEDDEEEPEEEDDMPGEEMHPDDLQELPPGADRDDRMHRELDRQRERQEAMDVEETAARLKERYGRQARAGGAGSAIVPQKLLMPGVNDPRIWRLKCRPGKEREIIFAIQHRIVERSKSREPVQIFSALERSGPMGGSIYVEAARQDDIMPALEGITHIFFGTKPQLIPVEEMPDLLRTRKTKQLEAGMYVRYKRGLYAGDLAQIEDIEPNGTEVELKVVPRLDYGLNEDANAPIVEPDGQGGGKRKRIQKPFSARPAARLFSENEAKKRHSKYLQSQGGLSRNAWTYQGKDYRDGFLLERVKISALQTENVNPTLEEVTRFAAGAEDGTENLDLAALAATLKTSAGADYLPGDKVEIFRGEQNGLIGRATEVYGEVVRIRVEDGPLRGQTVEAPKRDLRKLFKEGDHVKVIGGSKYQDEVGMVVKTKDNRVTILTDSTQTEISVFSKDLREATDSGGVVGASKYDLFDLVQLDASTVGCVIKVDRESLRVIDQLGSVKTLLPSNISNKIERRRDGGSAADRLGQEVKVGDAVKEYGGEGKSGPVLHIHRNFIFAQSRESRENAGVWVARCNNVEISAAKGGRVGTDLTKMNTALRGPNGGAAAPMPPPQQKGRDRLIGRTVRIRMGPQKGMIGIVKDATDDSATIELHAKNKKLPIRKDKLAVIDPTSGNVLAPDASLFGSGRPSGPPGRGGAMGAQTPGRGFGGPPPGAGGRTPAYLGGGGGGLGGRTPTWKQDSGARTPAYGGATSYGGGQTAYGGGQTAYGGGATSYGGGSVWGGGGGGGGMSTWNSNAGGGRTPAYLGGGSKTPAYTGMDAAPTPGFQDSAPTPGGNFDQPTPGAWKPGQYQTPAAYNTPGGFPETPGPYSAETPAAHDDGPRYD